MHSNRKFTTSEMIEIFEHLGEKLNEQSQFLDIAVFGGSSMMLNSISISLMDMDRATEDVDFIPLSDINDLQKILDKTTSDLGFDDRIFRKDIEIFIGDEIKKDEALFLFDKYPPGEGNLRIFSATPQYLCAMKCLAMERNAERDYKDLFTLIKACDFKSKEETLDNMSSFFPTEKLKKRSELLVGDMAELAISGKKFDMGAVYGY
jgi:hypothetical protein